MVSMMDGESPKGVRPVENLPIFITTSMVFDSELYHLMLAFSIIEEITFTSLLPV